MPAAFKTCTFKVPAVGDAPAMTYYFKSREGTYEGGISTETGIDEAGPDDQDMPCVKVEELLKSGQLMRLNAYGKEGTRPRSAKLLVTRAKLPFAIDGLVGKSINGWVIKKASFPRRATFY